MFRLNDELQRLVDLVRNPTVSEEVRCQLVAELSVTLAKGIDALVAIRSSDENKRVKEAATCALERIAGLLSTTY